MIPKEDINAIIELLDRFSEQGGGHMNIVSDDTGNDIAKTTKRIDIKTYQSSDCGCNNQACAVPTLHRGFEDYEKI